MDSSPREHSEIDELNRVLEVERQLVLRTQENYRILKERSIDLSKENKELRRQNEMLLLKMDDLKERRDVDDDIVERRKEIIRQMEVDCRRIEERSKGEEVETISQLQRIYRKDIEDREKECQVEKKLRLELEEENNRLIDEMRSMREDDRRKDKDRREERVRLERHVETLIREKEVEDCGSDQLKHYESLLEHYRNLILDLEDRLSKTNSDLSRKENEYRDELRVKESFIREEREERAKSDSKAARLTSEYSQTKEILARKDEKIEVLERKINELMVSKSAIEMDLLDRERKELEDRDKQKLHYESCLADLENNFHKRNEEFNELSESLNEMEDLRRNLIDSEEKIKDLEREREKRERKRREDSEENRRFRTKMQLEVERAREERDIAERKCMELKKRLESDPETADEVARLRKKVKESEAQLIGTKEHYRDLLKRLKTSLRNLEIRHQRAQEKLTSHIII